MSAWFRRWFTDPDRLAAAFGVSAISLAIVGLTIVLGIFARTFGHASLSHEPSAWGQFGDYVGGVLNPFFAFFSLVALIITLWLQRRENNDQRRFLRQQNFETTFFQMLDRFSTVVSETEFEGIVNGIPVEDHGRAALRQLYGRLKDQSFQRTSFDGRTTRAWIESAYDDFYDEHNPQVAHYFRTLYHIFKLIHNSGLDEYARVRYANIARSQLSTFELLLLFYNGLSRHGEGLKPLIEYYGLLKHVIPARLVNAADMTDPSLYEPTAFLDESQRTRHWVRHPQFKMLHESHVRWGS